VSFYLPKSNLLGAAEECICWPLRNMPSESHSTGGSSPVSPRHSRVRNTSLDNERTPLLLPQSSSVSHRRGMRVAVSLPFDQSRRTFAKINQSAVDLASHPPTRNGMQTLRPLCH